MKEMWRQTEKQMKKRFHFKKQSTNRYHYAPKLFTLHLDDFSHYVFLCEPS